MSDDKDKIDQAIRLLRETRNPAAARKVPSKPVAKVQPGAPYRQGAKMLFAGGTAPVFVSPSQLIRGEPNIMSCVGMVYMPRHKLAVGFWWARDAWGNPNLMMRICITAPGDRFERRAARALVVEAARRLGRGQWDGKVGRILTRIVPYTGYRAPFIKWLHTCAQLPALAPGYYLMPNGVDRASRADLDRILARIEAKRQAEGSAAFATCLLQSEGAEHLQQKLRDARLALPIPFTN